MTKIVKLAVIDQALILLGQKYSAEMWFGFQGFQSRVGPGIEVTGTFVRSLFFLWFYGQLKGQHRKMS